MHFLTKCLIFALYRVPELRKGLTKIVNNLEQFVTH